MVVKGKIVVGLFVLYGIIIAVANHMDNQPGHPSNLYHYNYIVEIYIIPAIDLNYVNEVSGPITGNVLLYLRIITSVAFWGGIFAICYVSWWASKTLISLKTK